MHVCTCIVPASDNDDLHVITCSGLILVCSFVRIWLVAVEKSNGDAITKVLSRKIALIFLQITRPLIQRAGTPFLPAATE